MRQGAPPELVLTDDICWLQECCSKDDISFCIRASCRYSPWAAETIKNGFLTAPGGHRIGLCGLALYRNGNLTGFREITSICIRVARDFYGIAEQIPADGSILILGAPGWGKTTLLRDLIRQRSRYQEVAVIDERGELFPLGFDCGYRTDILRGCHKREGIEQVLRTMGPACIALDEITAEKDCECLIRAANCGIKLLATAHAGSMEEFVRRPAYQPICKMEIFDSYILLKQDRHFTVERVKI